MKSYYSEFSEFPAGWIRNLINAGILPEGCVDGRSISEVQSDDLSGFLQCHFFAGVGGWPIALREAGWPEYIPVWTGSCPCQPFSAAGKGRGTADDRHLWPEFLRLIAVSRPPHIFGEQVSGRKVTGKLFTPRDWERLEPEDRRKAEEADSEAWFRHVQTDLERIGYIVGHCVLPAASVGGPHARQRLYWYARYVGDAGCEHDERWSETERSITEEKGKWWKNTVDAEPHGVPERLANSQAHRQGSLDRQPGSSVRQEEQVGGYGVPGGVADSISKRLEGRAEQSTREEQQAAERGGPSYRPNPTNGFWQAADWIFCRDNKWRPVEPGSSPLAHGVSGRTSEMRTWIRIMGFGTKVAEKIFRMSKEIIQDARSSRNGQLAGYGNAIVIPQAVEFIRACMEEFDE